MLLLTGSGCKISTLPLPEIAKMPHSTKDLNCGLNSRAVGAIGNINLSTAEVMIL